MAGLWRRRCCRQETRTALSLLQLGMAERAQALLVELTSQVSSGAIVVSALLPPLPCAFCSGAELMLLTGCLTCSGHCVVLGIGWCQQLGMAERVQALLGELTSQVFSGAIAVFVSSAMLAASMHVAQRFAAGLHKPQSSAPQPVRNQPHC